MRRGHARYFIAQADEHDERGFSIAHPSGLAWLSAERDNLRAALDWAQDNGDDALFAVAARAMCTWWISSGWAREGLRRTDAVLVRRADLPTDVVVNLLIVTSVLARFTGDGDRALAVFRDLLDLVQDNDRLKAASNADMAEILIHRGELDDAEAHLRESLRLGGGVRAKASLAELELARGNYDTADALAQEAERGFRGVHAYNLLATQEILGEVARRRGDAEEARLWFAYRRPWGCQPSATKVWPPTVSTASPRSKRTLAISVKPIESPASRPPFARRPALSRFVPSGGAGAVTLVPYGISLRETAMGQDDNGPTPAA